MTSPLSQLLGLKTLKPGDEGVVFAFAHPIPAWAWLFIAAGCFTVAAWSYSRLLGPRGARTTLAILRGFLLLFIVFLISGPQLAKLEERIEKDWVVLLADRSASMSIKDATGPNNTTITRDAQLISTLKDAWPTFQQVSKDRNLLALGFDAAAFDLRLAEDAGPGTSGLVLPEPEGRRTTIASVLDQTLRRIAARPVAGIVLLSDGRSADAPSRSLLRQLQSRQIPIFPVPLGSPNEMLDLSIARVEAPNAVFVGDLVPVNVELSRSGASDHVTGRVELVDKSTGTVLDRRPLPARSAPQQITLTSRPDTAGTPEWSVRVVGDQPDLAPENDASDVRVEIVSRPIRVAYFDGYPRWEYRYLKNNLIRERSMRSSITILSSERRYLQEGTDLLDVIPRTPQAWAPFDAIILGDLRPDVFSDEQLQQIKEQVASRGAGLMWIAGFGAVPAAWRGTPLADLLPFSLQASEGDPSGNVGPGAWLSPVVLLPGPASTRVGVLRLGDAVDVPWPVALSDPNTGWSVLRWAQKLEPATLKPTAETLALAAPVIAGGGGAIDSAAARPVVVSMRYGAGRVIYVATDEIWRYRFGRGEALPERFWIPLVRLLARDSLGRTGKPAVLEASPTITPVDQQVRVTVRLLDESLVQRKPPSITVRVVKDGAAPGSSVTEIELKPEASTPAGVGTFTGSWIASEPGTYRIDSQDPLLSAAELAAHVRVLLPDDEMRQPQADHAFLANLASETGGQVLEPSALRNLPTLLPNRQLRVSGTPQIETLWDKPIMWIVLMLLTSFEWIGRRLIKLS